MRFSRRFENDQVCTGRSRKVVGLRSTVSHGSCSAQHNNVNECKSVEQLTKMHDEVIVLDA